jgi:hypothetical protein
MLVTKIRLQGPACTPRQQKCLETKRHKSPYTESPRKSAPPIKATKPQKIRDNHDHANANKPRSPQPTSPLPSCKITSSTTSTTRTHTKKKHTKPSSCMPPSSNTQCTRPFGGFKRTPNFFSFFWVFQYNVWERHGLSPLPPDSPRQLDVLGHDRHPLCVDGTQVGVLEQTHQVGLRRLLKGEHGVALETQIGLQNAHHTPSVHHPHALRTTSTAMQHIPPHASTDIRRTAHRSRTSNTNQSPTHLEVLSDLADQSLKGQLPDQQLGTLLVLADLTAHHTHPVSHGNVTKNPDRNQPPLTTSDAPNASRLPEYPVPERSPKSDGSWPVAMWLLHSSGGGSGLPRSLHHPHQLLPPSENVPRLPCDTHLHTNKKHVTSAMSNKPHLRGQLLPRSLSSRGLTCCLLGTSHCDTAPITPHAR